MALNPRLGRVKIDGRRRARRRRNSSEERSEERRRGAMMTDRFHWKIGRANQFTNGSHERRNTRSIEQRREGRGEMFEHRTEIEQMTKIRSARRLHFVFSHQIQLKSTDVLRTMKIDFTSFDRHVRRKGTGDLFWDDESMQSFRLMNFFFDEFDIVFNRV